MSKKFIYLAMALLLFLMLTFSMQQSIQDFRLYGESYTRTVIIGDFVRTETVSLSTNLSIVLFMGWLLALQIMAFLDALDLEHHLSKIEQ